MTIILIRTPVGTYIGIKDKTRGDTTLRFPCMVDFLPIPVPGRLGGQTMLAMSRIVSPWPSQELTIHSLDCHALSFFDEHDKSELAESYRKTARATWPNEFKTLDS